MYGPAWEAQGHPFNMVLDGRVIWPHEGKGTRKLVRAGMHTPATGDLQAQSSLPNANHHGF